MAQLVGVSYTPKGCRFDSMSGHTHRLRVQSTVGAHLGDNNRSLSPPPPFLKSINIYSDKDLKKLYGKYFRLHEPYSISHIRLCCFSKNRWQTHGPQFAHWSMKLRDSIASLASLHQREVGNSYTDG